MKPAKKGLDQLQTLSLGLRLSLREHMRYLSEAYGALF